jgi:hypothetical protein
MDHHARTVACVLAACALMAFPPAAAAAPPECLTNLVANVFSGNPTVLPPAPCSDPDGDVLTIILVDGPAHGVLSAQAPDGTRTYTATIGYVGTDIVHFKASDGTAESSVSTLTINVQPGATRQNHAPLANADTIHHPRSGPYVVDVIANDSDPDGDSIHIAVVERLACGTLRVMGPRTVRFVPPRTGCPRRQRGVYRASDGSLLSNRASVFTPAIGRAGPRHRPRACRNANSDWTARWTGTSRADSVFQYGASVFFCTDGLKITDIKITADHDLVLTPGAAAFYATFLDAEFKFVKGSNHYSATRNPDGSVTATARGRFKICMGIPVAGTLLAALRLPRLTARLWKRLPVSVRRGILNSALYFVRNTPTLSEGEKQILALMISDRFESLVNDITTKCADAWKPTVRLRLFRDTTVDREPMSSSRLFDVFPTS